MSRREAPMRAWVSEPLSAEVRRALDRLRRAPGVERVAVMPDVHLAGDVCNGTVLSTRGVVYPAAVGSDIGCGMIAVAFRGEPAIGEAEAAEILRGLSRVVPTLRHHRGSEPPTMPTSLVEASLSSPALEAVKRRDGPLQLGTLGRGNHFVELQADEEDRLWVMVHSGSRGAGAAIASHHAKGGRGLLALDVDGPEGRSYLSDARWAVEYAEANRAAILDRVAVLLRELLGVEPDPGSLISCRHNVVQQEEQGGETLWVHRKGALSARRGEPGIVPGSMGTESFIVEGRGHSPALCSSSHGAGRAMTRSEARRRVLPQELDGQLRGVFYDTRVRDRLVDEAPSAYKPIAKVMRAQKELTKIVRRLAPVLAFKGV